MNRVSFDPVERAVAAATHARLLMFRDRSIDDIGHDLRRLAAVSDPEDHEAVFEAAIELLAVLEPDELERCASRVAYQRAIEGEANAPLPARWATVPRSH